MVDLTLSPETSTGSAVEETPSNEKPTLSFMQRLELAKNRLLDSFQEKNTRLNSLIQDNPDVNLAEEKAGATELEHAFVNLNVTETDSEIHQDKNETLDTSVLPQIDREVEDRKWFEEVKKEINFQQIREESNKKYDAKWKINPKDIADFYLSSQFIQMHRVKTHEDTWLEDPQNMALLKAEVRIGEIKTRILTAYIYDSLLEFKKYGMFGIFEQIQYDDVHKARAYFEQKGEDMSNVADGDVITKYIAEATKMLDEAINPEPKEDPKKKIDTPHQIILKNKEFFITLTSILGRVQNFEEWKKIGQYTNALIDPSIKGEDIIRDIDKHEPDKIVTERMDAMKDIYLIDRLLNIIHSNGSILGHITNDFPQAQAVSEAHGISSGYKYLLEHSNFRVGSDVLGRYFEQNLEKNSSDSFEEDLVRRLKSKPGNNSAVNAVVCAIDEFPHAQAQLLDLDPWWYERNKELYKEYTQSWINGARGHT